MKKLLVAATALGAIALTGGANAAVIAAGACVPGAFAVPCVAGAPIASSATNSLSVPSTNIGQFTVSGSANTAILSNSAIFNSQTLTITTAPGSPGGLLDVYFTVSGVPTIGVPLVFTSTFTSNQQNADTHSVIESTFLSNTNGVFNGGLGTPLSTATLNNAVLQVAGPFSTTTTPANPVSLTHLYQIELLGCASQTGGACTANLTIDLSAAQASEPMSLAILGMGVLGIAFVARKRNGAGVPIDTIEA